VSTDGTNGALFVWERDPGSGEWLDATKLTPPGGLGNIGFGGTVSISGNTIIAGADSEQVSGQTVGAVYVFTRAGTGTWARTQRLAPSDGANGGFGRSLSIDGDYLAVGVPNRDDRGEVHIFRRDGSTWVEERQVSAPDGQVGDGFGVMVAISGTTFIAAAFGDDDAGTNLGSVYVFDRNPSTGVWSMSQKLLPPVPPQSSVVAPFGRYLDIDGERCAIASPGDTEFGSNAGAVFVFERIQGSGWLQRAKLMPQDIVPELSFGLGVAIEGDAIVGGVGRDHDLGFNSGSAYVFRRNAATSDWYQQQKLLAPDGATNDAFGEIGVAIAGPTFAIGAPGKDADGISGLGGVYTFRSP
jgi:hypothetical protein